MRYLRQLCIFLHDFRWYDVTFDVRRHNDGRSTEPERQRLPQIRHLRKYVLCLMSVHVLCRNICTCVKRPYLRALNKGAFTVVESKDESEHLLVHFRHLIWTTDIKSDIGFTLTFGSVNAPLSHVFRIRQSHRFWSAVLLLSLVLNVTSMIVQYLKVRKTVSLTLNTNKGLNCSVLIR